MTKKDLYAEAKRLNIPGRSKMTRAQLEAALAEFNEAAPDLTPEAQHRPIDLAVMGNARERHAGRMAKTKTSAVNKFTERRIVKMVRASQSRQYGQGDRGLGAKHFSSGRHLFTGHMLPRGHVANPDADKMLSHGDRARHYAKQMGHPTASCDRMPGPVLTHRQWRRLDKKDNLNRFLHRLTKEARYV